MGDLIKLLPDNIANQIAAGEVIQRPSSVVKELMENSIDAGADRIELNIKDAGKTLIQVIDNGSGMSPADAELCFERHATSKVSKAEDLFALRTKGFRGEALASIAAIGHVFLKTKRDKDQTGYKITIEGSSIISKEETVCSNGTTFEVKNLFYNVPARRNFLKKDATEFRHIQDEFERIALAHPELTLILKHNGNNLYNLSSTTLRKRIADVFGNNINDKLVPIEEDTDIVKLTGYALKPEAARKTRGEQFFFVNNRYFRSPYFNHAINKAFEGLMKSGYFPGFCLYLDIDTAKIDVNVHPTKTEIKFEEEKFIYSILLSSVKQALGKYNVAPTLEFDQETSFDIPHEMRSQPAQEPTIKVDNDYNPFRSGSNSKGKTTENFTKAISDQGFGSRQHKSEDWDNFYKIEEEIKHNDNPKIDVETSGFDKGAYIVRKGLILTPSKNGLMVIHVRRASERILYDSISKSFISKPIESQKMLFPLVLERSKKDITYWNENRAILTQFGYEATAEGNCITITGAPALLQQELIENSIDRMLDNMANENIDKGDIAHEMIHSIARAASMQRKEFKTPESVEGFIEHLFQCENHAYSPGNKKIIETVLFEEIQKKFD